MLNTKALRRSALVIPTKPGDVIDWHQLQDLRAVALWAADELESAQAVDGIPMPENVRHGLHNLAHLFSQAVTQLGRWGRLIELNPPYCIAAVEGAKTMRRLCELQKELGDCQIRMGRDQEILHGSVIERAKKEKAARKKGTRKNG